MAGCLFSVIHISSRPSTTLTGLFAFLARHAATASVLTKVFAPKDPPIAREITLIALLLDTEESGEVRPQVERGLGTGLDDEPPVFPAGQRGVGLHGRVRRPGGAVGLLDHDVRLLETGLYITVAKPEEVTDVRALLGPDTEVCDGLWEAFEVVEERGILRDGLHLVEDGGKLLVLDAYEVGRRFGPGFAFGGDGGHHVSGVADAILGQGFLVFDLAPVAAEIGHVLRKQHHHVLRDLRSVYGHDAGVGHGRADEPGMQHPLQLHILGVTNGSGYAWINHRSGPPALS